MMNYKLQSKQLRKGESRFSVNSEQNLICVLASQKINEASYQKKDLYSKFAIFVLGTIE